MNIVNLFIFGLMFFGAFNLQAMVSKEDVERHLASAQFQVTVQRAQFEREIRQKQMNAINDLTSCLKQQSERFDASPGAIIHSQEKKCYIDALKWLFYAARISIYLNDDLNKLSIQLIQNLDNLRSSYQNSLVSLSSSWKDDISLAYFIAQGLASLDDPSIKGKDWFSDYKKRINNFMDWLKEDDTGILRGFRDKINQEIEKTKASPGGKDPLRQKLESLKESLSKLKDNLSKISTRLRSLKVKLS